MTNHISMGGFHNAFLTFDFPSKETGLMTYHGQSLREPDFPERHPEGLTSAAYSTKTVNPDGQEHQAKRRTDEQSQATFELGNVVDRPSLLAEEGQQQPSAPNAACGQAALGEADFSSETAYCCKTPDTASSAGLPLIRLMP
jgi:hypothetical protein